MSLFSSPLTRRRFFKIGSLMAGASLLPRPRVAHSKDLSQVTLRAATFRGADQTFLKETRLDDFPYKVSFSEFNSGNIIAQAINADALDIGGWSEIPMVFAATSGARISIVATLEGPTTDQALLVPTHSTAKSIKDLREKRIGYVKATTAHYFLIRMLEQQGLSWHDITPVALSISEGLTAMKAGSLDGWATYGYAIQMLEADSTARVLQSAADILSGHYFIGANPLRLQDPAFCAVAVDYLARLNKAYSILSHDKPRWAHAVSPVIQVPEPFVLNYLQSQNRPYHLRAWRRSDIASAQNVTDTFARNGALPTGTDLAPIFSPALSKALDHQDVEL